MGANIKVTTLYGKGTIEYHGSYKCRHWWDWDSKTAFRKLLNVSVVEAL